ncbi:MAG TPA: plastocyanin/azurin family copper-binding protein [Capillimicrobium sp.]|nr:plastocyanin/azurin family copper-binding protein [Capillimicrobium sp.]
MIAALLAAGAVAAFPTSVGVSAREYRFAVYRPTVPAGAVALNVHNYGEDDHDVVVRGPRGYTSPVSGDIDPGATLRFEVTLPRRGTYRLVCTKPGHRALGMTATLRVR